MELKVKPNFHAAIRIWGPNVNRAPEIFCICLTCLNFWIGTNTYEMYQFITQFHGEICPAALLPTDLPAEIEKAFSQIKIQSTKKGE